VPNEVKPSRPPRFRTIHRNRIKDVDIRRKAAGQIKPKILGKHTNHNR
jgi:hypothetical protein